MPITPPRGFPPGPPNAAVNTARFLRRPLETMLAWSDAYGPTFTLPFLGPMSGVWVTDPSDMRALCSGDQGDLTAGASRRFLAPLLGDTSMLVLDGPQHLRQRRVILPAFKRSHGEEIRDVVRETARREVEAWHDGREMRMVDRMQSFAFEVICRAVFGVTDDARVDRVQSALMAVMNSNPIFVLSATARGLPGAPFNARLRVADKVLLEEIRRCRSAPDLEDRGDILALLLRSRHEDGSEVSDAEARDQLLTMLSAGFDTTAGTLGFAFELLYRAPDRLARLRETLAAGDDTYLDAVVKEVLRLRPVVHGTARRLTRERIVGGWTLPPGTDIIMSLILMHHREDLYEDARSFVPDRFLGPPPEPFSFLPFGGGVRRCVGAMLVEVELAEMLRAAVPRLDVALGPERPVGLKGIVFHPRGRLPVSVRRRPAPEPRAKPAPTPA